MHKTLTFGRSCSMIMFLFLIFLQVFLLVNAADHKCGRVPVRSVPLSSNPVSNFIFNGIKSVAHTRPWEVAIRMRDSGGRIFCGGSLIAPYWVLTAAHCMGGGNSTRLFVHTGAHTLTAQPGPQEQFVEIEAYYPHPEFSAETVSNDIGLLKLASPVTYNSIVQPICLSAGIHEAVVPGAPMIVAGWGDTAKQDEVNGTEHKPVLPEALLEISVSVLPDEKCHESGLMLDETMFCAGKPDGGPCRSDSGSPTVMQNSEGQWFQVGVVSFGIQCGQLNSFAAYNRAYNYCEFIESTIEEKICLPSIH